MTTFAKVLSVAMSQRGVKESPSGSNRQKYGVWYGWNGVPWCAQYVSWFFNQSGGLSLIGGKSASVAVIASRMRLKGQYGSTPRAGALAVFNNYSHIELVVSVNTNGTVSTIGGNTSDSIGGSISNGGGVFANTRSRSLIRGYCYPAYSASAVTPTPVKSGLLVVDGALGPNTYRALQKWLGVPLDGTFNVATKKALQKRLSVSVDGSIGPKTIVALQELIGTRTDGSWGPATTKALQVYLNNHR